MVPVLLLKRLIQLGNDVNGVEASKEHAEIAATRIKVYDGDFLEITMNKRFDLVLFADVLSICISLTRR